MKFKAGLVIGGVIGYVLGTRAGRQRYDQIRRLVAEVRRHPAVAQLIDQAGGLVDATRYTAAALLSAGGRGLRSAETKANQM